MGYLTEVHGQQIDFDTSYISAYKGMQLHLSLLQL